MNLCIYTYVWYNFGSVLCTTPPPSLIFDPARQFVVTLLFAHRDDDLYSSRVPLFGSRSALAILYLV